MEKALKFSGGKESILLSFRFFFKKKLAQDSIHRLLILFSMKIDG